MLARSIGTGSVLERKQFRRLGRGGAGDIRVESVALEVGCEERTGPKDPLIGVQGKAPGIGINGVDESLKAERRDAEFGQGRRWCMDQWLAGARGISEDAFRR
ncbi:MAG: hypothetical protein E6H80_13690 [Betaproteobacteria bacterium]|nr:MAG: hypothetical protein E6H80_13690 [Betaproteobacteria bacterium]